MSVNYLVYCEARKNHCWVNIDFWQRAPNGNNVLIPTADGRSILGLALRRHELLSQRIKWEDLSSDLKDAYQCYPDEQDWRVFDYSKIENMNFEMPQFCGYISKAIDYDADPELRNELILEAFENGEALSPSQFAVLTPSAQQGFRYCEFTYPYGQHAVMRNLIRNINHRITAYRNYISYDDVKDVRIVVGLF